MLVHQLSEPTVRQVVEVGDGRVQRFRGLLGAHDGNRLPAGGGDVPILERGQLVAERVQQRLPAVGDVVRSLGFERLPDARSRQACKEEVGCEQPGWPDPRRGTCSDRVRLKKLLESLNRVLEAPST